MSCLLHFIFFLLLLLLPLASSYGSGCPTQCGKVKIQYPFGVGSGCSMEASFNITCNTSTAPPKPYLNISDEKIEVVEIRVDNPAYIRIKYPYLLWGVCYHTPSGNMTWTDGSGGISLRDTQYTLSEYNWLIAIGCDDALTASTYKGQGKQTFRDGCIGICFDDHGSSGSCPKNGDGNSGGDGCCRSPIPKGASTLSAGLTDLSKSWKSVRVFPCSYAFLMEKGSPNGSGYSYNYSILKQKSTDFINNDEMVVRLDWRAGNHNCSHTPRNSSFACKANTDCVDFGSEVEGYLCKCSKGYVGNPYVACQDINECDENPCAPHSHCKNLPGSFNCTCSRGYNGDGIRNGTGCTLSPTSNVIKIALIGLGSALGLVVLVLLCLWLHKVFEKRKNKKRKEDLFKQLLLLQHQTSEGTFGNTKLFTAKELEKATDHFNEGRICGRGGQGVVYKGMLSDGTIVAIKKLKEVDENQVEQFINEVVILSQINHKNVVRLLGCCLATEGPQLVYEFLPNGILFEFIHDRKIEFPLTWKMRLKIAADVAGALAYLHFASSIPIYHRDIKSTNILLDEKYVVKVSDFGISKLVQVDQTHLTTLVKGTFGYLDPEYYQTSQYTEKSDVYSFGVVLLELLTGQRPISLERTEVGRNLAAHFLAYMEADNLDAILDTQVSEEAANEDVIAVARLARRCLNVKGKFRPTMKEVATELESLMISQIHSIVDEELEETTISEAKHMMVSDIEYTWTISDHTTSSDAQSLNV
ncbi:wall-associated receptor kinase-like 1 [Salvia miltiorrhiza]|uniref:wall-associated receptor kinase-like 1 n=1 Tax=Salvia miltiorrhiza TaxID=226208 RepID=UPI0025AD92A3|nr:wall-associated receptor kinase-like 1 [Salvia miltiorrhiza]